MYPKIRLILNIPYKRWNSEGEEKENLKLLSAYMYQTSEQFFKYASDTLFNNQQIIEEIKKEIKICIETNEK